MTKKVLSLLLALSLCLTLLPTAVLADEMQEPTTEQTETVPAPQEETPAPGDTDAPETPDGEAPSEDAEEPSEEPSEQPQEPDAEPDAEPAEEPSEQPSEETPAEQPAEEPAMLAAADEIAVQASTTHSHPICGASCTDGKSHSGVTWIGAYNLSNSMGAAKYYLNNNVTLTETWHPADGTVLCLNGYTITTENGNFNAIEVDKGVTFTLTDCGKDGAVTHGSGTYGRGVKVFGTFNLYGGSITDNRTTGGHNDGTTAGAGVYVASGSTFRMYGGKVTGNNSYSGGGGVYVCPTYSDSRSAVFEMSGGEISDNTSSYAGGGVYVYGGNFTMSGGTITGNKAGTSLSSNGGGVYLGDYSGNDGITYPSTFTVSGKVSITGNTKSGAASNVYLPTGKTITIGGTLSSESTIGITTQEEASAIIAADAADVEQSIFSSDVTDKGYTITKEADGTLRFNGHDHQWVYTLKNTYTNLIYAECHADNCPLKKDDDGYGSGGTIGLYASNSYTYNGQARAVYLEYSSRSTWPGEKVSGSDITYENTKTGKSLGTTAPVDPGTYKASITANGVTAYRTFTIDKLTPTITDWGGYETSNQYTGSPVLQPSESQLTVRPSSGSGTINGIYEHITFTWYKATKDGSSYTKGEELDGAPTDAGDYYIEADFEETDLSSPATDGTGFTIGPMTEVQEVTAPVYDQVFANRADTYQIDLRPYLNRFTLGNNVTYGLEEDLSDDFKAAASTVSTDGTLIVSVKAVKPDTLPSSMGEITVSVHSSNYEQITLKVPFQMISKPEQPLTVTMPGWTYGGTASELQVSGLPVALTDPNVTVTYTNTKTGVSSTERPTNAGSYTVTVSYETEANIYTGTAAFTVRPKALQQEMLARITGDRYYNGMEQTPDVTVTDGETTLRKDVDYTVSYSNNEDASTPTSQAVATVTGTGNYEGTISTTFVINPVTLTILKEDRMTATAPYGTAVKDIPVSSATVCYNGAKVTIVPGTWKFDGDGMDDIPEVGNTKEYKAVFTPTSGSKNYRACFTYITPAITQIAGSVTPPTAKTDLVYNGKEQALLAALPTSATGTVLYSLDGTNYTETPPTGKDAGDYTVWYKVESSKNYLGVDAAKIDVKIKTLTVTVTAESKTSRVGQPLADLTYICTPELAAGDAFTGTLETDAKANAAGDYRITQGTLALSGNYTMVFHAGTYTVTDKQTQSGFRFESIPSNVSKTYGDPDFSAAATGAAPGSTVTYKSSDETVATVDGTGKVHIRKVGSTTITAEAAATDDYVKASVSCTLTVTQKSIALPVVADKTYTYDGTAQTYVITADTAYVTLDNVPHTDADTYTVTASLTDTANTRWADGTTDAKTYTFTIAPATVTVTVLDQSATVGEDAPDLSAPELGKHYTVAGLLGEDALGGTLTLTYEPAPDMTQAGETAIKASGLTASANYTIVYEDGTLTIAARPVSSGGSGSATYPVNAPAKTESGSVTSNVKNASKGDTVTITVTPESGYAVGTVTVKDASGKVLQLTDKGNGVYTFTMPAGKVEISAAFTALNANGSFRDVSDNAYYADAVKWAVENGVTEGTGATTFSPNAACTRAQIVTFLWRAAGSPAPKSTKSFADVPVGSYYANAVAWAVENGITEGTSAAAFSPNAACTRAQIVTFLFRSAAANGLDAVTLQDLLSGFADADSVPGYAVPAMNWALYAGVLQGDGTNLMPNAACTRAQIVTFLFRANGGK